MKSLLLTILFCFAGVCFFSVVAQETDFWITAGIIPKLSKRWDSQFYIEYRSKNYFNDVNLFSTTGQVSYTANKHVGAGIGYEFYWSKIATDSYNPEERLYAFGSFSQAYNNFTFNLRIRFQDTYIRFKNPVWELRNRLQATYNISKYALKPYVSVEPYYTIDKPVFFNKTRYIVGCTYLHMKRHEYGLYYLFEKYEKKSFYKNVIGISYDYLF